MLSSSEDLQFAEASFDVVTCFGVFPHLDNKKVALKQFHMVLKSKGKLIIAHALSSAEVKSHHQNAGVVAYDLLPSRKDMEKLLLQAGFTEIEIVDKQGSYLCTSTKP